MTARALGHGHMVVDQRLGIPQGPWATMRPLPFARAAVADLAARGVPRADARPGDRQHGQPVAVPVADLRRQPAGGGRAAGRRPDAPDDAPRPGAGQRARDRPPAAARRRGLRQLRHARTTSTCSNVSSAAYASRRWSGSTSAGASTTRRDVELPDGTIVGPITSEAPQRGYLAPLRRADGDRGGDPCPLTRARPTRRAELRRRRRRRRARAARRRRGALACTPAIERCRRDPEPALRRAVRRRGGRASTATCSGGATTPTSHAVTHDSPLVDAACALLDERRRGAHRGPVVRVGRRGDDAEPVAPGRAVLPPRPTVPDDLGHARRHRRRRLAARRRRARTRRADCSAWSSSRPAARRSTPRATGCAPVPDVDADPERFAVRSWSLQAGDAIALDSRTLHATGPRRAARRRSAGCRPAGPTPATTYRDRGAGAAAFWDLLPHGLRRRRPHRRRRVPARRSVTVRHEFTDLKQPRPGPATVAPYC